MDLCAHLSPLRIGVTVGNDACPSIHRGGLAAQQCGANRYSCVPLTTAAHPTKRRTKTPAHQRFTILKIRQGMMPRVTAQSGRRMQAMHQIKEPCGGMGSSGDVSFQMMQLRQAANLRLLRKLHTIHHRFEGFANTLRHQIMLGTVLGALKQFGDHLAIRVSVDHYAEALHELERGAGTWAPMIDGLTWLASAGFNLSVAGRTCWKESEAQLRTGYARVFAAHGIALDAQDAFMNGKIAVGGDMQMAMQLAFAVMAPD